MIGTIIFCPGPFMHPHLQHIHLWFQRKADSDGAYPEGPVLPWPDRHYEPPGQNVSIVSQMCLIFVSNCLKRSQFCLKHVSDKMSHFGLNLRPFWHLRHNWDCPYLRAIWEQFEKFFCVVKKVSKRSQTCLKKGFGGFSGSMVDRWSFQVPSLYIQTLLFHNYNCMVYSTIASYYLLVTCNQLYCIICLHS